MINLDSLSFKKAIEIYNDNSIDNEKLKIELEKGLGVLSSQGIFGMYLLFDKESKIKNINEHLKSLIEELTEKKYNDFEKALTDVARDLDKLIVIKQSIEQVFIYLRYKLKGTKTK